ncbi:transposase [Paenibacillus eucommiae]|uniref:Transposase n=1 Tax=Paenibacillus eucommiae TaxID=1355755 RepID=A0ABS4IVB2_9BACL|nr:transposase [Paenibacillus eucommiae]MBP1990776.1 transposase [Paenibacillus eucommiae]
MKEQRKSYSQEFKENAVKYIQEQVKSLPEIAEEMNIPIGTLRQWMGKYRKFPDEPFVGSGHLRSQDQLNKEKDQEIADLKEEIAILKKAMHIFSKERN